MTAGEVSGLDDQAGIPEPASQDADHSLADTLGDAAWYVALGTVALVPLLMANRLDSTAAPLLAQGHVLLKAMALVVGGFGSLALYGLSLAAGRRHVRIDRSMLLAGLLAVWALVSALMSPARGASLIGSPITAEGALTVCAGLSLLCVVASLADSVRRVRSLAFTVAASAALVAAYGWLQVLGADPDQVAAAGVGEHACVRQHREPRHVRRLPHARDDGVAGTGVLGAAGADIGCGVDASHPHIDGALPLVLTRRMAGSDRRPGRVLRLAPAQGGEGGSAGCSPRGGPRCGDGAGLVRVEPRRYARRGCGPPSGVGRREPATRTSTPGCFCGGPRWRWSQGHLSGAWVPGRSSTGSSRSCLKSSTAWARGSSCATAPTASGSSTQSSTGSWDSRSGLRSTRWSPSARVAS